MMFVRKSAALLGPLRDGSYAAGKVFTAADISCGYAVSLVQFLACEDQLDPVVRGFDLFHTRRDRVTGEQAFLRPRLRRAELWHFQQTVLHALAIEALAKRVT